MNKSNGMFVTFEGGEGVGKSLQISLLASRLRSNGFEVEVTREPGGSPGAEAVRYVLLNGAAEPFGPAMEAILFAAARTDHICQRILPALEAGKVVLCDRFIDSSRVYQGVTGNLSAEFMEQLEEVAIDGVFPDLTIVLDLPAEIGLKRATVRRGTDTVDRFEKESVDVHERRRQAFLEIARNEPDRCVVINGDASVAKIAAEIDKVLDDILSRI